MEYGTIFVAWGKVIFPRFERSPWFPPLTDQSGDRWVNRSVTNFQELSTMPKDRTTYSLSDEQGEWTTITLSKWIADVLQANLPNVHEWLQTEYNKIVERFPWLTRREKGDKVRMIAFNTAAIYLDDEDLK